MSSLLFVDKEEEREAGARTPLDQMRRGGAGGGCCSLATHMPDAAGVYETSRRIGGDPLPWRCSGISG